ncbi:MAG: hypothetical protein WC623_24235 [Pedobacter sp.]|uniref:hypothetical protein n=1 Tax=Pedobacter sp. TaxID=1411316 RepID=UPI00356480F1
MEDKNIITLTTYKGFEIYYNFDNAQLTAVDEKTQEEFEGKYLFEIQRQIDKPQWELCNKKGYAIDGIFSDEIYKLEATRYNSKSGRYDWIKKESSGSGYEVGKRLERSERKVYEDSQNNHSVFLEAKSKQQEINRKKRELQDIIGRLSTQEKKKEEDEN